VTSQPTLELTLRISLHCHPEERSDEGLHLRSAKRRFIAEFQEAACPTSRDVCRSREQNQGDTDLTDETDSTDRSSVGSAPCATSREEVFDNSTPIAFGYPCERQKHPEVAEQDSSGLVGSGGVCVRERSVEFV